MAVNWIVEATQSLERKEAGADRVTAQEVKVDPILSDAIDIALERQLPTVNENSTNNSKPTPAFRTNSLPNSISELFDIWVRSQLQ